MEKRIALGLVFSVGSMYAQAIGRAESFVLEVADFARSARSWRGEGTLVTKASGGKSQTQHFRIAYQQSQPYRARLEIIDGPSPLLRICDGSSQWTFYPTTKSYVRVMLPKIGPCAYPINAWPPLANTTDSLRFAGTESIMFNGPAKCRIIQGRSIAPAQIPDHAQVTVCVDPVTKLIARFERSDSSSRQSQSYSFQSMERNVPLDPNLFLFHPPDDAPEIAIINWLDPSAPPTASAFRLDNSITVPELTDFVPPVPRFPLPILAPNSGVVLTGEVNADGLIENIKLTRSLGKDLDNDALEAVRKWRFEPGYKEGKPVSVVVAIAVLFSGPSIK